MLAGSTAKRKDQGVQEVTSTYGSGNVSPDAIDIDDAQAMAERFGPPADFEEGSQVSASTAKPVRSKSKAVAKPKTQTAAQKQKAADAAKKQKEAAAAKAKRDKEKAAAAEQRKKEREAATAAKKSAEEDLTGLVPKKATQSGTVRNIAIADLVGIDGGDPVEKSFVEQIRLQGVLQPIRVRELDEQPGKFNVLYGKRRAQAVRALNEQGVAGFDTIPATIEKRDDSNDFILGLAENYSRSNNVIEEGRMVEGAYQFLMAPIAEGGKGLTERKATAQIVKATGMTPFQIKRARRVITGLRPELVAAVEAGDMTKWTALHVARMSDEKQQEIVAQYEETGRVTAEVAKQAQRSKQYEEVNKHLEAAAESGQDLYAVPGEDKAEASAPKLTRAEQVANVVNSLKAAVSGLEALKSRGADEDDALTMARQAIEFLTTGA